MKHALSGLMAFAALLSATAALGAPAASNVRGAAFPAVNPDRSVTFQVKAPTAQKVQVQPGAAAGEPSGLGAGPFDMVRDRDGVWSVTLPPGVPGLHYYWLLVDGVEANDPGSETFFGYNKETSAVEVPEPGLDFYLPKDVPHGEVRAHWYFSKLTGSWRKANVYTPPGYDSSTRTRYPVLYLRHGGGENVEGWVNQGKMNFIMDNLLAAKRATPMLVVMDNGYAEPPGVMPSLAPGGATSRNTIVPLTLNELMPSIDANFRTLADREHRAMAGLSMGSAQTLQITLPNLDKFAWIGAFSRPAVNDFNTQTSYDGAFKDPAGFNKQVRLLWLGAGTAEHNIHDSLKRTHELLDQAGVRNVFVEFPGTAHEWQTWRKSLYDFAPRLFR